MEIVLALVALVVGLGLGWFFGNRPLAEWQARFTQRDTEARELDGKFREAIVNLAAVASVTRDDTGRQKVHIQGHPEVLEVSRSFAHLFRGA